MKVIFENNSVLDAGNGLFTVTEYIKNLSASYTFVLECVSDGKFLGEDGWQDTGSAFVVNDFIEDKATIKIFVGPYIVDNLDAMKLYKFILINSGQTQQHARLQLSSIIYSPYYGDGAANRVEGEVNIPETMPVANNENLAVFRQIIKEMPEAKASHNPQIDNAENENAGLIDKEHIPILKWFFLIWLIGCLFLGSLLFGEMIVDYFLSVLDVNQFALIDTPMVKIIQGLEAMGS